jgi:predicted Na+-dependent transporter
MLASAVAFLLRNLISALMLSVGASTTIAGLRATWSQRSLVWRALIVLFLGVPALALATAALLPLDGRPAHFIVLMAICPGTPMVFRSFRDRTLLVALIAIVGLVAPFAIWAWVSLLEHVSPIHLHLATHAVARTALEQLLPLAVGVALASTLPRVARAIARISWYFFAVALAFAIVIALLKGGRELFTTNGWSIVAVLVMVAGSIALGQWAGYPTRESQRLVATMAVLGNPALAVAVLASTDPGYRPVALFFAYLIARAIFLFPYAQWSKRWTHHGLRVVEIGV